MLTNWKDAPYPSPTRVEKGFTISSFVKTEYQRYTDRRTELVKQYPALRAVYADALYKQYTVASVTSYNRNELLTVVLVLRTV